MAAARRTLDWAKRCVQGGRCVKIHMGPLLGGGGAHVKFLVSDGCGPAGNGLQGSVIDLLLRDLQSHHVVCCRHARTAGGATMVTMRFWDRAPDAEGDDADDDGVAEEDDDLDFPVPNLLAPPPPLPAGSGDDGGGDDFWSFFDAVPASARAPRRRSPTPKGRSLSCRTSRAMSGPEVFSMTDNSSDSSDSPRHGTEPSSSSRSTTVPKVFCMANGSSDGTWSDGGSLSDEFELDSPRWVRPYEGVVPASPAPPAWPRELPCPQHGARSVSDSSPLSWLVLPDGDDVATQTSFNDGSVGTVATQTSLHDDGGVGTVATQTSLHDDGGAIAVHGGAYELMEAGLCEVARLLLARVAAVRERHAEAAARSPPLQLGYLGTDLSFEEIAHHEVETGNEARRHCLVRLAAFRDVAALFHRFCAGFGPEVVDSVFRSVLFDDCQRERADIDAAISDLDLWGVLDRVQAVAVVPRWSSRS